MNINPEMIDKALGMLPYPISKTGVIERARQFGANQTILGMLEKLPDRTYNSPDEIKQQFGGLGNLGNLGGLFGGR